MSNKKVWFVTGASKGLGLALVKELLDAGHPVAATSRSLQSLTNAVDASSKNFLPLEVDILDEKSISKAVQQTIEKFGTLDVLVNNAGYGMIGSLEELSDAEARSNFDVNVFGSLNLIRQVMPQMRKQSGGHILNVSSIGGFSGNFPGFGIYCATKFAVHGFSESLAAEAKQFGVRVTIVSPGYFRTNFLDSGSIVTPKTEIADYKAVRDVQDAHQQDINGNQPGDPVLAAKAMIEVTEMETSPLHLFLGADAYQVARTKIKDVEADMAAVESLATSTSIEVPKEILA